MFWLKHFLFDAARIVGLRDRLRCPECSAVGTWKPHGGLFDWEDKRRVPRWLCKWCGHYLGPEGVRRAGMDETEKCWSLDHSGNTPAVWVNNRCWPWRGQCLSSA